MNVIGWLMTASILSGIVFWVAFCLIDAFLIRKTGFKSLITPSINWGPYLSQNKRLAKHLDNLENYHEASRRSKSRVN